MARTNQLAEGFSFAGTFLFSQKADAEGIAAMLGLQGAFPMQTDEGLFWMPGTSYDELLKRIYSDWTLPDKATVPQAHPQDPQQTLPFLAWTQTVSEETEPDVNHEFKNSREALRHLEHE